MPVFFFSCITFLLLLLLLLVLAAAAFFHFVGSYADSVEIERRSQSRRWAHSTKSQSPIFAEHFSSESLTQLFFSHRSFASAAKCNRTLACHIVWMWIYIYIFEPSVHVFKYTRFLFQYYTEKSNLFPRTKWNCAHSLAEQWVRGVVHRTISSYRK